MQPVFISGCGGKVDQPQVDVSFSIVPRDSA